ncbi:helix-turn-helix domain-containing protein [Streptomyces sp. NPDC006208]
MRAGLIELSRQGMWVQGIAAELGCSQKTVRCRLYRFNSTPRPAS